ncbi:uncharacterized protein LOC125054086 [Pieris napi]|uniref:uncharacterized protein LOC125054086 n=1 Tax=Pieris napi TaxID=78633 RepID=UPI001FBBF553|nr:uncharacterized protein LOC125054086 [Pieris napi]
MSILRNILPSCEYKQEFNNDREVIEDIIKPIIMTATFFGLLPISINFSKIKQIYVPVPKSIYLNSFRCVTFILLNIVFLIFHIYLLYASAESSNFANLPKRINYIFENLNFLIVCVTAYVSGFLNRYIYLEILNKIICAWTKMPPSDNGQKILKKIAVQCYIILLGIMLVLLFLIYFNSNQVNIQWKLVLGMSLNMPQTIQLVYHGFYTVLVILLAAVLCRITEHFKSPTQSASIIEVRPKQRHLSLVEMKSLYIEVYEIKLIIEQAFKAPLTYSLLQSFHSLIAESYFIFYGILYSKDIPTYIIYACAEWILCQVIKVYSLSYSGNLLKNAVRIHSRPYLLN